MQLVINVKLHRTDNKPTANKGSFAMLAAEPACRQAGISSSIYR